MVSAGRPCGTTNPCAHYADSQGKIQVRDHANACSNKRNNVSKKRESTTNEGSKNRPREGREINKYK